MKEYKVGEKFKFQDMPLGVVETKKPTCTGCFFEGKIVETLRCASCERSDHKNVIFKKIEG